MSILRTYLPLVGFVVPTVVIGYGFVIPRSCIAGVNELSVGFGTTVLGAVFTYVAGQRAVVPAAGVAKQSWLIRLMRKLDERAFGGRITAQVVAFGQMLQPRGGCDVGKRLDDSLAAREAALCLVDSSESAAPSSGQREQIPELADVEAALRRLGFAIVDAQRCRSVTKFRVLVARHGSDGGAV